MKEYNYNGYTIKQVRREVEGLVWEAYKEDKLIGWDNKKQNVEAIVDWYRMYDK